MTKEIMTIEQEFALYVLRHLCPTVTPTKTFEQRHAFFLGFKACLDTLDVVAEISDKDEDEGDRAWQVLHAEFERFAQAVVSGEVTIHH